jgi:hypothetical protein
MEGEFMSHYSAPLSYYGETPDGEGGGWRGLLEEVAPE